jgi:hypothetical protein
VRLRVSVGGEPGGSEWKIQGDSGSIRGMFWNP